MWVWGICELEAKDTENLDIHTFPCETFRFNFCDEKLKNVQDIKTHWSKYHNGKNISIKPLRRERDHQEFLKTILIIQEN